MDLAPAPSPTRRELLDLARERGVPGRDRMTKGELARHLAGGATAQDAPEAGTNAETHPDRQPPIASRLEPFRRLAQARADGDMVLLPRVLTGDDRRVHVRQTIREDHQVRIARGDEESRAKFDKLAGSLFSFFRGTSLLFYRDMAGEDAWMPTVLAAGDVHPDNFGVLPNRDEVPVFGIDDHDEAFFAPFTWDLKRGATGFVLAADELGGKGRGKQQRIARAFVEGYVEAIGSYVTEENELEHELRRDNSPKLVRDLIDDALSPGRARWLAEGYLDEHRRGFKASKKLVPVSSRREEFQGVVDRYVAANDLDVPERTAGMRVKDVAERKGQGTASLGLTRYYVLVEGCTGDGTDDVVLEFKQARRSALDGLVPPSDFDSSGHGDRVAHAQRAQLARADVFYGSVEHDGLSLLVRERSPLRNSLDLGALSTSQWVQYARVCGGVVAQVHALSDEGGGLDHDVEPAITAAIGPEELFVDDVVRFAGEAAERARADHAAFRADHALGAFRRVDVVYR
ncbi:DUF2252 domain-containing protein [Kineococcus auxinigenes]|uniref:DUF2252 domain-containing protein n=1 Tax=Kineococcus sp. SYSU DK014 TaxID=3383135 RepID=UPI003D7DDB2D